MSIIKNYKTNIDIRKDSLNNYREQINRIDEYSSLFNIVLNVCNICNNKCSFCPQSHMSMSGYKPFMDRNVIDTVIKKLGDRFNGTFSISGFGEPLLHPEIENIINIIKASGNKVSLITNGTLPDKLFKLKPDKIKVSIYNKQWDDFYKVNNTKFQTEYYLNIQYINGNTAFNNRAGNCGPAKDIPEKCCNIPFMKLTIDTNGDILQCCSDWKRTFIIGNIFVDDIWDIWINKLQEERRKLLTDNRSECMLCSSCNAPGDLYGKEFKEFWKGYYEKRRL